MWTVNLFKTKVKSLPVRTLQQ